VICTLTPLESLNVRILVYLPFLSQFARIGELPHFTPMKGEKKTVADILDFRQSAVRH
jgi:hypothetical protein